MMALHAALISGSPSSIGRLEPVAMVSTPRAALALYLQGGTFDHSMPSYHKMEPICLLVSSKGDEAISTVRFMLRFLGVDVNVSFYQQWTPLLFAAYYDRTSMVIMLVDEFGADVNVMNELGYSPLHYAVRRNSVELTNFLLERGADPLLHKFPHKPIMNEATGESAALRELLLESVITRR